MSKILFYDIEVLPAIIARWDLWSQGGPDNILKDKGLACIGYKWGHEKDVQVLALPDYSPGLSFEKGLPLLLKDWLKVVAKADMIVTHYGAKFDYPMLQGFLAKYGLPGMPDTLHYDTCRAAKRSLKLMSNSLDYIGTVFGLGNKIKISNSLWLRLLQKDHSAYRELIAYNVQDVLLLEQVYHKLKVYDHKHPLLHIETATVDSCPACGSENTRHNGTRRTARCVYQRVECKDCGKWSQKQKALHVVPKGGNR